MLISVTVFLPVLFLGIVPVVIFMAPIFIGRFGPMPIFPIAICPMSASMEPDYMIVFFTGQIFADVIFPATILGVRPVSAGVISVT